MPFFDFHIHPVLKSLFSETAAATPGAEATAKFSPWEKVRRQDIPFLLKWCSEFQYILESQACLSQLVVNDCNLICAVLYIAEQGMIDNGLVKGAAKSKLKRYIQQARIDKIINGNPYDMLINDDLPTLTNPASFGVNDRKVKLLKKRQDYTETDTSTVHVVFTLEGLHSLGDGLRIFNKTTIINRLDELSNRLSLISVNPTHIEQSPFCNHAFAMPYLDDSVFIPTGNRISNDGLDIIDHCYSKNILIDVKHMSLGARMHLYQMRDLGRFTNLPPLVCTHAGFAGISRDDIADYIYSSNRPAGKKYNTIVLAKPVKYDDGGARACFNPSSINLYDEDIVTIINSGGMIGLSLDKRILGYSSERDSNFICPVEKEFVSAKEEELFLPGGGDTEVGGMINELNCATWKDAVPGGEVLPNAAFQHLKHFMSHVLHLIVLTGNNATAALKQVCIGSDFDGLINPVWCCETTDDLYHLKQDFKDHFKFFAKNCGVSLPGGFNIDEFCEDLFFRNGRDFIMKRLDILNP